MEPPWRYTPYQPRTLTEYDTDYSRQKHLDEWADRGEGTDSPYIEDLTGEETMTTESDIDRKMRETMAGCVNRGLDDDDPFAKPEGFDEWSWWKQTAWYLWMTFAVGTVFICTVAGVAVAIAIGIRLVQLFASLVGFLVRLMGG